MLLHYSFMQKAVYIRVVDYLVIRLRISITLMIKRMSGDLVCKNSFGPIEDEIKPLLLFSSEWVLSSNWTNLQGKMHKILLFCTVNKKVQILLVINSGYECKLSSTKSTC